MKWWSLLAVAALTSGCGSLGRPPLPKFATGLSRPATPAESGGQAALARADVIYVGLTNKAPVEASSFWKMVETLQQNGARVALGWAELPATEQVVFEQWQRREISGQQLLDQVGTSSRRDWMRRALRPDLAQVALGSPRELLRKTRSGEAFTHEESAQLPRGYQPPPEALDNFADHVSASPRLRRYNLEQLYQAHLIAEQSIAENIVRFMHDHPGTKLIVFLPDDAMINPREVADYVAQRGSLQQMILDRAGGIPKARPQLLARGRRADRLFQIVDRAPKAGRHDRRLAAPRLPA